MPTHTEHDSLGPVEVPAGALYGPQTQRAVENFQISGLRLQPGFIRALCAIKAAAAKANAELKTISVEKAKAIEDAADRLTRGEYGDQFPIDVFQTGSGTSTNMNANEVIAHLAAQAGVQIHPNDDVNLHQSSNDVIPTAIHVSAAIAIHSRLL